MKVAKWGNSLAVRLPREIVRALDLKEGDDIKLSAAGHGDVVVERDERREAALRRIRDLARPAPPGFRFDRNELYDTARNGFRRDDDGA